MNTIPTLKSVIPGVEVVKFGAPLFAQVELTSKCPYRCVFCYNVWKLPGEGSEATMTREQAFYVADQLIRCRLFSVILSGGEPTLQKYLVELVEYYNRHQIDVDMITNGALLTDKLLKGLLAANLQSMQISMHHYKAEKMAAIADNPNAFTLTLRGLEKALKVFGPESINVNMVVMQDTIHDIEPMGEFLHRHGVTSFSIGLVSTCGQAVENMLVCTQSDLQEAYNQLERLHTQLGMAVAFTGGLPFCSFPGMESESVQMANICDAAMTQVVIGPEGNIRPCVELPQAAGNIFADDIIDVWKNSPLLNGIRRFENTPIVCRACGDVASCHGGCRASALASTGDLLGLDPMMPEGRK